MLIFWKRADVTIQLFRQNPQNQSRIYMCQNVKNTIRTFVIQGDNHAWIQTFLFNTYE